MPKQTDAGDSTSATRHNSAPAISYPVVVGTLIEVWSGQLLRCTEVKRYRAGVSRALGTLLYALMSI